VDVLARAQVEDLNSVIGDGHDVFPVNRQRYDRRQPVAVLVA
jgi:hypothetical protein